MFSGAGVIGSIVSLGYYGSVLRVLFAPAPAAAPLHFDAEDAAEAPAKAGSARISVQHPIGLARTAAERDEVVDLAQRRFGAWGGLVAGTVDEVITALRAERDAGAELFICQFHDFGTPESIRLFADEVLPALH